MYFIETLKKKFPTLFKDITEYDEYLKRHHSNDLLAKIFSDEKENFKFVEAAYAALAEGNVKLYQRNMCYYERTLNDDPDFLDFFIEDFFSKDSRSLTVDEKKKLINEEWIKRGVITPEDGK